MSPAERNYPTERAIRALKDNGFQWHQLRSYFPFGFLDQREGEYANLLHAALSALSSPREQELLLDLLDTQWCAFVEQCWVANEEGDESVTHAEPAFARIEINQCVRSEFNLPRKPVRQALMGLEKGGTLLKRIIRDAR